MSPMTDRETVAYLREKIAELHGMLRIYKKIAHDAEERLQRLIGSTSAQQERKAAVSKCAKRRARSMGGGAVSMGVAARHEWVASLVAAEKLGIDWERTGFLGRYRKAKCEIQEEEDCRMANAPGIRPDASALFWREGIRVLAVLEVENTHPLDWNKIVRYIDLWSDFDATMTHEFELYTCDKTGNNAARYPLATAWIVDVATGAQ